MGKRRLVFRLCSLEILHHHLSVQSGSSLSLSLKVPILFLFFLPPLLLMDLALMRVGLPPPIEWGGVGVHLWESGGRESN